MANPLRPSPLSFDSGRQSPFKRQNSASPATVRATTPTQSPTKINASLSPIKSGSLSPEKASPFVRRPSTISQTSERPSSPFARPSSSLSIPTSPFRKTSAASRDEDIPASPRTTVSPEETESLTPSQGTILRGTSPSPFDRPLSPSPAPASPVLSQANLRPAAQRTITASSAMSTIKPPIFNPAPPKQPKFAAAAGNRTAFKNVPATLLHSMRESFEVLDPQSTNAVTSANVANMLEQMGLPSTPAAVSEFFPPNVPSSLNLARYLDTLSGPLTELSPPHELMAAFSAFDVDDSGQIDVADLRRALLDTPAGDGEGLNEREVDAVLGEFSGRRAFGARGTNAKIGKGEVFRYKEFMGAVNGGVGSSEGVEVN